MAAVLDLTPSNFTDIVGRDSGVLVEFYTPWCGHCKQLEPVYNQLADSFAHSNQIHIAKIDSDEYKKFVKRWSINSYPTIKYFPPNNGLPVDYTGDRDMNGFISFIKHHSHIHPQSSLPSQSSRSPVIDLTDDNFHSFVYADTSLNTLILFYAPWCSHCKRILPAFDSLGISFSREDSCQVAKINVDESSNADIQRSFKIGSLPTLKLVKGSGEVLHYDKSRTLDALVDYVNTHCNTNRQIDGNLNDKAGLVEDLDSLVEVFMRASGEKRLEIAETTAQELGQEMHSSPHTIYLRIMSKIISHDAHYIPREIGRLGRLLGSQMLDTKRDEIQIKMNILNHFSRYLHILHTEL
ncbi:hypothetical protein E3P91_03557 [Wallemia ichthyophaga]|nr:hypothetical protein E3P91_03557 [Wallemia ichthyophaga]TIB59029.1 hypothetical protein E3P78_03709 [Wallemia ichthyophaga]